jgi:hypothetical protein
VLRRSLNVANKRGSFLLRRRALMASKAVSCELKRIGGRQLPHDVRIGGLADIDWARIVRVGNTGHSNNLIGRAEDSFMCSHGGEPGTLEPFLGS